MQHPLIAGNWKMHGSLLKTRTLLTALKASVTPETPFEWLVCPPFPYLPLTAELLVDSPIRLGAQNISIHVEEGAFTGEVSGVMLKDCGASYVIVGHSERRHLFKEDEALCATKAMAALAADLVPIFCVGETLVEREAEKTFEIIAKQLEALLGLMNNHAALENLVIAYEPVWAIGSGKVASLLQIQAVHAFIRAVLLELDAKRAAEMRLIYGGSVNASNAAGIMALPDVNGVLVGGASLEAHRFFEIGQICSKSY